MNFRAKHAARGLPGFSRLGFLFLVCCSILPARAELAQNAQVEPEVQDEAVEQEHDPLLELKRIETWRDYRLSPMERRFALERASRENPFVLTPHRPSYLLPVTYNLRPNPDPFEDGRNGLDGDNFDRTEAKFQISLKSILLESLFGQPIDLAFGYTQQSYWQVYNRDASRPFRETVHEPELFLYWHTEAEILGWRHRVMQMGINHQSNGQSEPQSRSWNRLYAEFVFERGNWVLGIRPWYRLPEDESKDDNPDIHRYLGYGDVGLFHYRGDQVFGMLLRNNLRLDDNKGSVQLEWSFPLYKKIRGYVQYFYGYGESLIDYDHINHRLGLGFMLVNWI